MAPYLRALAMCRVRTTAYYRGRSGRKRCRRRECLCLERPTAREPYVALKPARADTVHVYRRNMGSRAVDRSRVVHSCEAKDSQLIVGVRPRLRRPPRCVPAVASTQEMPWLHWNVDRERSPAHRVRSGLYLLYFARQGGLPTDSGAMRDFCLRLAAPGKCAFEARVLCLMAPQERPPAREVSFSRVVSFIVSRLWSGRPLRRPNDICTGHIRHSASTMIM